MKFNFKCWSFEKIFFNDYGHFLLDNYGEKQNYHIRGRLRKSEVIVEKPLTLFFENNSVQSAMLLLCLLQFLCPEKFQNAACYQQGKFAPLLVLMPHRVQKYISQIHSHCHRICMLLESKQSPFWINVSSLQCTVISQLSAYIHIIGYYIHN